MIEQIHELINVFEDDVNRLILRYDAQKDKQYSYMFEAGDVFEVRNESTLADFSKIKGIPILYQHIVSRIFLQIEKMMKRQSAQQVELFVLWFEANQFSIYIDRKNENECLYHLKATTNYEQFRYNRLLPLVYYFEGVPLNELKYIGFSEKEDNIYDMFSIYDSGVDIKNHSEELSHIHATKDSFADLLSHYENKQQLQLSKEQLLQAIEIGTYINLEHDLEKSGELLEKELYTKLFAKRIYYTNELEYVVDLFIEHNNLQAFANANKRTSFAYLLNNLSYIGATIQERYYEQIAEAQLLYLEDGISVERFKIIILFYIGISNS